MYLVMAFTLKNMAIVHQQYFNDPVGGYHKGYDYYGDQFAACFIRHLKGNAARFHIDPRRICCFMLPWDNEPARNISPFFLYADHREPMRKWTREVAAKAKAHDVIVEATELSAHTWPFGTAYDQASAFADRILQLDY